MGRKKTAEQQDYERGAAQLLKELLRRPGRYRDLCLDEARCLRLAVTADEVPRKAVAALLSHHMSESYPAGEFSGADDVVHRLYKKDALSAKSLGMFIEALGMDGCDADELRAVHAGEQESPFIVGVLPEPGEAGIPEPLHHTLSVQEELRIGSDGLPSRLTTTRTIRIQVDGLDHLVYRTGYNEAKWVTCVRSGKRYEPRAIGGGIHEVQLSFGRALKHGDTATLKYVTIFQEASNLAFRRVAHWRVNGINLYLQFHPKCLPRQVFWSEWSHEGADAPVVNEESIQVDGNRSAHRYLLYAERAAIGYRWTL